MFVEHAVGTRVVLLAYAWLSCPSGNRALFEMIIGYDTIILNSLTYAASVISMLKGKGLHVHHTPPHHQHQQQQQQQHYETISSSSSTADNGDAESVDGTTAIRELLASNAFDGATAWTHGHVYLVHTHEVMHVTPTIPSTLFYSRLVTSLQESFGEMNPTYGKSPDVSTSVEEDAEGRSSGSTLGKVYGSGFDLGMSWKRRVQEFIVTKFRTLFTSLFVICTTSMSVSFTLRETQSRMVSLQGRACLLRCADEASSCLPECTLQVMFLVQIQQLHRLRQPTSRLVCMHLLQSLVFVPIMIGILFFLFEFYDDQLLAFLVLALVRDYSHEPYQVVDTCLNGESENSSPSGQPLC